MIDMIYAKPTLGFLADSQQSTICRKELSIMLPNLFQCLNDDDNALKKW